MSQTLTYVIGQDRRPHVDNVQDFKVNFDGSNTNWVQARQYERSMRQVFVNIKNEDGTPLDLTGCNVWFEGLLPKNSAGDFRVIDDKGYVALDPTAGRFRFDMPGHAFTVAGSYRQAFFRILKDGNSITTLEFDLDVLADKVIDGLVPRTYISPVEELINEIEAKYQDSTDKLTKMTSDFVDQFTQSMNTLKALGVTVQNGLDALEAKIKQDNLFTQAEAEAFKQAIMKAIAINYAHVYPNVAAMKADSALSKDMCAKTLGYYAPNDGGGGLFYVTDTTTKRAEQLASGLLAELIENEIIPETWGAHGDGKNDDYQILQSILTYAVDNNKSVHGNGCYLIESPLAIDLKQSHISLRLKLTPALNADQIAFKFRNGNQNDIQIMLERGAAKYGVSFDTMFHSNISIKGYYFRGCILNVTGTDADNTHNIGIKIKLWNYNCYQTLYQHSVSQQSGFGEYSFVWEETFDIADNAIGSVIDSTYDLTIKHWESHFVTNKAGQVNLKIMLSKGHIDYLALGGKCDQLLTMQTNSEFTANEIMLGAERDGMNGLYIGPSTTGTYLDVDHFKLGGKAFDTGIKFYDQNSAHFQAGRIYADKTPTSLISLGNTSLGMSLQDHQTDYNSNLKTITKFIAIDQLNSQEVKTLPMDAINKKLGVTGKILNYVAEGDRWQLSVSEAGNGDGLIVRNIDSSAIQNTGVTVTAFYQTKIY